ncbi:MAG: prolyl oligopeptidase family serine peptidase [bacterium]|nr:prolyl oligopeptidase family serine peptidase [bacterium]
MLLKKHQICLLPPRLGGWQDHPVKSRPKQRSLTASADDKESTKDKKDGKGEQKEGDEKSRDGEAEEKAEEEHKVDERQAWADVVDESKALQLTDNGEEDYEFSKSRRYRPWDEEILDEDAYLESLQAGEIFSPQDKGEKGKRQEGKKDEDRKKKTGKESDTEKKDDKKKDDKSKDADSKGEKEEVEDTKTKPRVSWAPDSSAFYVSRRDSRGGEKLFLVNSLTKPRPSLETYNYPLPGETHIGFSELYVFDRTRKEFFQVEGKWKDESYQNLHWPKAPEKPKDEDAEEPTAAELAGTGDELRLVRRDRLLRNLELCSINTRNGECRVIFDEGFVGANISTRSLRYLKQRNEMIWWSERSGWGHFYLLDKEGKPKNAITSGPFRASRIVEVDQDKGLLYFLGNGREAGENIYFQHLYRVFLDGTGLTLLDPGNANHSSTLSPTQRFLVDNSSRIDMAPVSRLCDADGKTVMELEQADLSRLYDSGWTMPTTFKFKAADGVTDLYGNMWKPFDFDPKKSYPIIAEVYPGPQTEGVSHSFSSSNGRQQLAQVGFIVVQLGHCGGTSGRSKAYHSYGYFNLRDYGLADKKAGLEQLAERHPYVDLENVGIYGHSGGGFMTAAALLREPYNDFFKVGVSSSGNHDNNVYGRHWAERYHGLKEVEIPKKKGKKGKREEDTAAQEKGNKEKQGDDQKKEKEEEEEVATKFEIDVPTNAELAANLKWHLLLVHGDMDNNVHPAGTMRLVDALIKADKRFDMLIIPGKRHGYGNYSAYFTQRKWEFFAEHLLGDHQPGADILEKE